MANRWVDEIWWRDWIFWAGAVVATSNLAAGLVRGGWEWWQLLLYSGYAFAAVVAVLGFVRVAVRTYREPPTERQ